MRSFGSDRTATGSLVALLLAIVIAWWMGSKRNRDRRQFEAHCRRVAGRLQGTFQEGTLPVLRFSAKGRAAELRWGAVAEAPRSATWVRVDLRGCSPGALKIFPEDVLSRVGKLFGTQDLRVGDERFDARYVVRANPESLVRDLSGRERRLRLVSAMMRTELPLQVDLTRDELVVSSLWTLRGETELDQFVRVAVDLTAVLLEFAAVGVYWTSGLEVGGGLCPVCGGGLNERRVDCSKCRTPHHRECWEYAGQCSTFACGEVRSRSA